MIEEVGICDTGAILRATLAAGPVSVDLLSIGAATVDWRIPVDGRRAPMILGYADVQAYLTNPYYLGVVAGRVANRIGDGRFELGGEVIELPINSAPHHLHGGPIGLSRRNWQMEMIGDHAVKLNYDSPHGEDGYPGAVAFSCVVSLDGARLTYDFRARPDRPTPIALAQHNYYTLGDPTGARAHRLQVSAHRYTPNDATLLPTGERAAVDGTRFDFTKPRSLAEADPEALGYDVNLLFDPERPHDLPAATLLSPAGIRLQLWTDQRGIQLYDAVHMPPHEGVMRGQVTGPHAALCLEPQAAPNTVNIPAFGSIICTPDAPYRQVTSVEITSPEMRAP